MATSPLRVLAGTADTPVVEQDAADSFTIHLNGTVSSSTPVTWIVFDPSLI